MVAVGIVPMRTAQSGSFCLYSACQHLGLHFSFTLGFHPIATMYCDQQFRETRAKNSVGMTRNVEAMSTHKKAFLHDVNCMTMTMCQNRLKRDPKLAKKLLALRLCVLLLHHPSRILHIYRSQVSPYHLSSWKPVIHLKIPMMSDSRSTINPPA